VSSCFAPHTQHSSVRLPASLTVLTRLDYGSVTLNAVTKRLQDWCITVVNTTAFLRVKFRLAVLVFCCTELPGERGQTQRRLRSATTQKLVVRRTRLRTIGDRAFGAVAPRVWRHRFCTVTGLVVGAILAVTRYKFMFTWRHQQQLIGPDILKVWIALKTVQIKHNVLIRKSRVNCIYVKKSSYYIHGPLGDENIFAVLHVTLLWALHVVIKQQFFTFIFAVFLLNLLYTYIFC